ncbi:MAG: carboxymuconolactone decarboxylase family protein [Thermodesulfobacteriota bacterium]
MESLPEHYRKLQGRYATVLERLGELSQAAAKAGPLDAKTAHLVQLAAAAALRAEGAVHSHTRRALDAGATEEEVRHALILLTSTLGFPTVSAALSWADDILEG